ncbi:uncharacterized protein LOC119687073 [Teleopsis dalmanni]|uniref:uncharacterized protein LOC119687073 n=1 Tax=Teleopsis dalmanni TaxID=139649 RepID=UPI000D32AE50|nr:uncharacterized protein LOC119687073 [Teleopsis dalmanni]
MVKENYTWDFVQKHFGDLQKLRTELWDVDMKYLQSNLMLHATLTFMIHEMIELRPENKVHFVIDLYGPVKMKDTQRKVTIMYKKFLEESRRVLSDEDERNLYEHVYLNLDDFVDPDISCPDPNEEEEQTEEGLGEGEAEGEYEEEMTEEETLGINTEAATSLLTEAVEAVENLLGGTARTF